MPGRGGVSVAIRHRILSSWSVTVFAIAFGLNSIWELAQASLYQPMGTAWEATRRCLVASVGDGALVLTVLVLTRTVTGDTSATRRYVMSIVLALVMAVAVEWWGLSQGRWAYLPSMPRIPGTALGIVPLLQLALLTPATLWLAGPVNRKRPKP